MLGLLRPIPSHPLPKDNDLSLVLRHARDLVEKNWIQKALCDRQGGYCVLGALGKAFNGCDDSSMGPFWPCNELVNFFATANGINPDTVSLWNDRWWRTKQSVLRAFDRAIYLARTNPHEAF